MERWEEIVEEWDRDGVPDSAKASRVADLEDEVRPRPLTEWHEDDGNVLCFTEPIDEPPYCGSPMDEGFPWVSTALSEIMFVPLPRIFRSRA